MRKKIVFIFVIGAIVVTMALTGCSGGSSQLANTSTTDAMVSETVEETTVASQGSKMPGKSGGGLSGGGLDTSAIEKQYTDISYGNISASQTLNIYLPNEGEGPFPVIIAIHGGAFKMGTATGGDVAAMLEGVNRGYAVVSINYRLSGEAIFPAAVSDCKAAIRFIKANAKQYNLDANKLAVWGDSAGGNLAAMMGTIGNVSELDGDNGENLDQDASVQVVIDWFGPLEFLKMDEQFADSGITPVFGATSSESSPESQYIGQLITLNPELTQKANPSTYIATMDQKTAPKFLIQHGTNDGNVPAQQSIDFAGALKQAIGDDFVTLELLDGAGHGTQEFTSQENLDKVFQFLDSHLK